MTLLTCAIQLRSDVESCIYMGNIDDKVLSVVTFIAFSG